MRRKEEGAKGGERGTGEEIRSEKRRDQEEQPGTIEKLKGRGRES